MKAKERGGKGKQAGKRGIKDLPSSPFKGIITKSVPGVVPPIPQGNSGSYTHGDMAQDLK